MGGLFVRRNADDAMRREEGGEVFIRWIGVETSRSVASVGGDERIEGEGAAEVVDAASVDAPRRLYIKASMGTEDRAGDVIEADGWDLGAFERNPVFLWAHERWRPPIGRSVRTWIDGDSLMAQIEFAPTSFANEVADLFERGFMRGVSVGFRPLEMEVRKTSDGRRGLRFVRQELLEISAAPVPMHADALSIGSTFFEGGEETEDLREAMEDLWSSAAMLVD